MGLCKCERKKVTTLFCFEHRVNVCDFCMVANHPRCIVKPYLLWLKDSEFDPSCQICHARFEDDDTRECVRLVCLDVFHSNCLHMLISSAPPTTAPSGFLCPSCEHPIIPQRNQGGPVAEALRSFLNRIDWSKGDLADLHHFGDGRIPQHHNFNSTNTSLSSPFENTDRLLDPRLDLAAQQFLTGQELPSRDSNHPTAAPGSGTSGSSTSPSVNFEPIRPVVEPGVHGAVPWSQRRDLNSSVPQQHQQRSYDHFVRPLDDDDKYKRRVALGSLARLFSSSNITRYFTPSRWRRRRTILSLVVLFILILVLVQHMHRLSSLDDAQGDPLFDPHMNPNIHLDEHAAAAIRGGVKYNPGIDD